MSGEEVPAKQADEERDVIPGGDDPAKSSKEGGKGLSETVKALVKTTVEEEMAKLKAGSGPEHPNPSGSLPPNTG